MEAVPTTTRFAVAAVAYVVAFGAGAGVFAWVARRRGIGAYHARVIAAAGLFGGLVGAGLVQLVVSAEPGRTLLGGVGGGWIAVILAKRSFGIRRPMGDPFAFALAAGEAIGRIGCFAAGCCYGKIADVAWAVHDHGAPRHPTQLYASLAALATLGAIAWLERRRTLPDGAIFLVQGALLCALRFTIEFFRDAPSYGGLTTAQYACVAGFAFFAWRLSATVRRASDAPAVAAAAA